MNDSKKIVGLIFILCFVSPSIQLVMGICENRLIIERADNGTCLVGTESANNYTATWYKDGVVWNCTEVIGAPGFDIRLNYTATLQNLSSVANVNFALFSIYEGNPAHVVELQAFNFDNSSWVTWAELLTNGGYVWMNFTTRYPGFLPFVGNSSEVWLRICHPTTGTPGHIMSIDYASFEAVYLVSSPCINETAYYGRLQNPIISDKWISANDSAGYNDTEKAYSLSIDTVDEDLTTWTETDSGNYITVNETHSIYDGNGRGNTDANLLKTVTDTDVFEYFMTFRVDQTVSSTDTLRGMICKVSDYVGDWLSTISAGSDAIGIMVRGFTNTSQYQITLHNINSGNLGSSAITGQLLVGTDYYIKFNRTEYLIGCFVYTDQTMSTLVTSATQDLQNMPLNPWGSSLKFEKIMITQNMGYPTNQDIKFTLQNLSITTGYTDDGIIYSTDLMVNKTVIPEYMIFNMTMTTGQTIEVAFSNDNSTWQRASNFSICSGGSIYIRDLALNPLFVRFRLFKGVSSSSPLINSYEVLYLADCNGGVSGLSPWDINWLTAVLWIGLVAIGVFKSNKIMMIFAGFFGLIFGLLLLVVNLMVAIAVICLNLYLIYEGTGS